ncbi:MAG: nucleoside triphosphate pyrophosphohydrolase [Clostridia bacterium]|nr:nucleoside triphosphate pyrophosphohydrolase [Clostridia bacterium]MBN2883085.1 nucleoside triphosphate pyrophosphohydrolase [Clostridia bacterium]
MKKEKYTFDDLQKIMAKLRGPEGCPWDREQTHESLKRHMLEETYEALEAIEAADDEMMKEELGDVLLQIVFHGCIAEEDGRFDTSDIVDAISRKLIERHTHVFGEDIAKDSKAVLKNWDRIKNKSKGLKSHTEKINAIPKTYPALLRSLKIQEKAAKAGFDWNEVDGAIEKTMEEINEFMEACQNKDKQTIKNEMGDLLFSLVNVCRFMDIEPEITLQETSDRFSRRFAYVEESVHKIGKVMEDMSLAELDELWDKAKEEGL